MPDTDSENEKIKLLKEIQSALSRTPLDEQPALLKKMIEDEERSRDTQKLALCEQKISRSAKNIEELNRIRKIYKTLHLRLGCLGLLMGIGGAILSTADAVTFGGGLTFLAFISESVDARMSGIRKDTYIKQLATAEEEKQILLKSLPAPKAPEPPQISALLKLARPASAFNGCDNTPAINPSPSAILRHIPKGPMQ